MKNIEMEKLVRYLEEHDYFFRAEYNPNVVGAPREQVVVYDWATGERLWDAVVGFGTYGFIKDDFEHSSLETMGLRDWAVPEEDDDGVIGWRTALDIIYSLE